MTDTPDIEALIAEARGAIQRKMRSGALGAPEDEISDLLVDRMADDLERQQAVVEAAHRVLIHYLADDAPDCQEIQDLEYAFARIGRVVPFAALDASPEGEG